MNDLTVLPKYSPKHIKYLLKTKLYINGLLRGSYLSPIYCERDLLPFYFGNNRKVLSKIIDLYGDFIYCKSELLSFLESNKKEFNRFIDYKTETNEIKIPLECDIETCQIENEYIEIREEIISFIEQKMGISDMLLYLKELFSDVNEKGLNYEEYRTEKVKHLLASTNDKYIDYLNKITKQKNKFIMDCQK